MKRYPRIGKEYLPSKKRLNSEQRRFNAGGKRRGGTPGSKAYKRYIFGHMTNVRKGRV